MKRIIISLFIILFITGCGNTGLLGKKEQSCVVTSMTKKRGYYVKQKTTDSRTGVVKDTSFYINQQYIIDCDCAGELKKLQGSHDMYDSIKIGDTIKVTKDLTIIY